MVAADGAAGPARKSHSPHTADVAGAAESSGGDAHQLMSMHAIGVQHWAMNLAKLGGR